MDLTFQPDQNSHINVVLCNIVMSRCNKQVQGAIIFYVCRFTVVWNHLAPNVIFTTVDGWNPASQLRLVVYANIYLGFIPPRWWSPDFNQYVGWLILISPNANLQNLQPLILCIHSSWKYMDVKSPGCQIGHNFFNPWNYIILSFWCIAGKKLGVFNSASRMPCAESCYNRINEVITDSWKFNIHKRSLPNIISSHGLLQYLGVDILSSFIPVFVSTIHHIWSPTSWKVGTCQIFSDPKDHWNPPMEGFEPI